MKKTKYILTILLLVIGGNIVYGQTLKFVPDTICTQDSMFLCDKILIDSLPLQYDVNKKIYVFYTREDSILINTIDRTAFTPSKSVIFKLKENNRPVNAFIDSKGKQSTTLQIRSTQKAGDNVAPHILLRPGNTYTINWHDTWNIVVRKETEPYQSSYLSLADSILVFNANTPYKKNKHFLSKENGSFIRVSHTDLLGQTERYGKEIIVILIAALCIYIGILLFKKKKLRQEIKALNSQIKESTEKHTHFITELEEILEQEQTQSKENKDQTTEQQIKDNLKSLLKKLHADSDELQQKINQLEISDKDKTEILSWLLKQLHNNQDDAIFIFEEIENKAAVFPDLSDLVELIQKKGSAYRPLFKLLQQFNVPNAGNKETIEKAVENINNGTYEFLFEKNPLKEYLEEIKKQAKDKPKGSYFISLFNSIKNKLDAIKSNTAVLTEAFESSNLEGTENALLQYLIKQINQHIEKEEKQIPTEQWKLNEFYEVIARKWIIPANYEEAIEEGKNRILEIVKPLLGEVNEDSTKEALLLYHSKAIEEGKKQILAILETILGEVNEETIDASIRGYYTDKVNREIIGKLNGMNPTDTASVDSTVVALNKALEEANALRKCLATYQVGDLENLIAEIKKQHLDRAKTIVINTPVQNAEIPQEEIRKLVNMYDTIDSFTHQFISIIQIEANVKVKALETIQTNNNRIVEVVCASKPSEADFIIDKENAEKTVSNYGNEINRVLCNKKQEITQLTGTINQLNEKIKKYTEENATVWHTIKAYHSVYVKLIQHVFNDIVHATSKIYTGKDRTNPLAKIIDKKIMENDICSLSEFRANLETIVNSPTVEPVECVKENLRKLYVDCLQYDAPTWIDILARMYAYAQVPYIAGIFNNNGINALNISAAFELTRTMLKELDIEITFPHLFTDLYEADKYDLQSLNNIGSYFEDIFNVVDVISDNVVIDLYSVGFSVNGEVKEKPKVSRFN